MMVCFTKSADSDSVRRFLGDDLVRTVQCDGTVPHCCMDATGKFASYANWVSVAIEHENDASRAQETMNKLQLFNAPLKVLITYAPPGSATDSLLRKYENIIRASDVFNDVATLRQQLVIIGTPKTVAQWRLYAYENDGFVLMLPA